MKGKTILVVANHEKNLQLLANFLEDEGYQSEAAATVAEVDEVLEEGPKLDMALLDVTGFGDSIWNRCERIRKRGIPFFIISPSKSKKAEKKSLSEGARDVLTKPLEKGRLLKLVAIILGE
ncbi:MAG: response regulator [Candidatus Bipolaricaulota bacterium]